MNRVVVASLLLVLSVPGFAGGKLRVTTTTTDLGFIVATIGGEEVTVKVLTRGYQDPHYLEPKPSFIVELTRADALFFVGLDLETGWLPRLLDGAHNPNIQEGRKGLYSPAGAVKVLEIPTGNHSRAEGDIHPNGNPHYWLSPDNFRAMVIAIRDRLEELRPEASTGFRTRAETLTKKTDELTLEWTRRLESARGMRVITYHRTLNYFLNYFGVIGVDYIEPRPGIPPSSRHLADLIATVGREKVELLLVENLFESRNGQFVADKTGVPMVVVPISVDGDKGTTTWFDLMEQLVSAVESVARR